MGVVEAMSVAVQHSVAAFIGTGKINKNHIFHFLSTFSKNNVII